MSHLTTPFGPGRIARLTESAITYGVHLHRLNVPARNLSQALYDFHRLPVGCVYRCLPAYQGSITLADEIQSELARQGYDLETRYERRADVTSRWLHWFLKKDAPESRPLRHKLYVSPALSSLRETLLVVSRLCAAREVPTFKLGLDEHGLSRSDKLVVFFDHPEARRSFVREALAHTAGMAVHGVPLTREVGADGLLSIAEDSLMGEMSWRQLITTEIVDILCTAGEHARHEPVEAVVHAVAAELDRRGLMQSLVAEH